MKNPRSDTVTLVQAMRVLARDIQSEDGVANAAIAEAAQRLAELDAEASHLRGAMIRLDSSAEQMSARLTESLRRVELLNHMLAQQSAVLEACGAPQFENAAHAMTWANEVKRRMGTNP